MYLTIGTTTVDLFITGFGELPRFEHDEFSNIGLAWCDRPLTAAVGGNGANSAYVLAALGAHSALVSAVGADLFGTTVHGWLSERGVDLRGLIHSQAHGSATTTAVMDGKGRRISFYHPGPLHDMKPGDLSPVLLGETTTLLITGPSLLPGMRWAGYNAALHSVHGRGGRTALDIGPALGVPVTLDELTPLLPVIDVLLANDYELGIFAGTDDLDAAAQRAVDAGARLLVLKRGKEGASAYRPGQSPLHVAGFPVAATNTVGAGDTFNAGLLYALGHDRPLEAALAFGCAAASIVVERGKSVLGAPSPAEVEARLRGG
ncbi:MAG: carbohydrate kinase family protein [Chloroflexi bacterium]|nr:carbohydrate kinase family protein [Chloroflexota bacterium]